MASPLIWKVFSGTEHTASLRYPEDAAALVYLTSRGVVRVDGRIVWREGAESMSAGDSYDAAAELMQRRRAEYHAVRTERRRTGCAVYNCERPRHTGWTTCDQHYSAGRNVRQERRALGVAS